MEERIQTDGAIYTNNYKETDKQPDWTGKVAFDKALLKLLVDKIKNGEEAEVRVALWDRRSKNGNDYKYARFDIPQQQKQQGDPRPTPPVQQSRPELSDDDIPF